jgi:hypothetical protein
VIFGAALLHLLLAQTPARPLIDVPFVAQTPELCGGAAVSMVLRYWGQRDVFPQDFASLVSRSDGGIQTGALVTAVRDRGWQALVEPADAATPRSRVRAELDKGRPIISLIEVAPGVHHYVVIVGSTEQQVVFHDPAKAPFRVLDWAVFDKEWAGGNRWMMVALPPASAFAPAGASARLTSAPLEASTRASSTPCRAMVMHAVSVAVAGNTTDADQELTTAMALCPRDASARREMAGLRFTQKRWADANEFASAATRLDPDDSYSWQLAGTSRYLMGDTAGALSAWNHMGEPRVDAVAVHGAERTRVPVIVRALGLEPRTVLTPDKLTQSIRRLRDVPAVSHANVKFEPVAGGLAKVDAVIVERPAWPHGRNGWLRLAAPPALQRELRLEVSGLSGEGDSAFAAWRFAQRRQKVSAGLAFPSPRIPGVTMFSAVWEEEAYAPASAATAIPLRETRRRAGLEFSDWAAGWLKWQGGAALDRFNSQTFATADAAITIRPSSDRAAFTVFGAAWQPFAVAERFATAGARAQLRSTSDPARQVVSVLAEMQRASADAPLALWPSAGTGVGTERASLLRGHQLVEDGYVSGDAFGRQLANVSVEYTKPVATVRGITVALAGFVDAARASMRRSGVDSAQSFVDAGLGLRLRLPGGLGGVRLDLAHPIGDGRLIFSGGWIPAWPR